MKCIYIFFFLGSLLRILLRADGMASSKKMPGITSIRDYLLHYKVVLIVRLFVAFCLFVLIVYGGTEYSPKTIPALLALAVPVACALSGILGYGGDGILEEAQQRIAFLRNSIPPVPGDPDSPTPASAPEAEPKSSQTSAGG